MKWSVRWKKIRCTANKKTLFLNPVIFKPGRIGTVCCSRMQKKYFFRGAAQPRQYSCRLHRDDDRRNICKIDVQKCGTLTETNILRRMRCSTPGLNSLVECGNPIQANLSSFAMWLQKSVNCQFTQTLLRWKIRRQRKPRLSVKHICTHAWDIQVAALIEECSGSRGLWRPRLELNKRCF